MRRGFLPLALCVALGASSARAADFSVPLLISHQGRLLDGNDHPVSGQKNFVFNLHTTAEAEASGGDVVVWSAAYSGVQVSDGAYSVVLGGGNTPLLGNAFDGDRWLGISIEGGAELRPRLRIAAAPYALVAQRALDAERIGGHFASDFAPTTGAPGYIWNGNAPQNASLNLGTGSARMTALQVDGRASVGGLDASGTVMVTGALTVGGGSTQLGETQVTGKLGVAQMATFSQGFTSNADALVLGRLSATKLEGASLQLGPTALTTQQLGMLVGGPLSNADALHTHADTGTKASSSPALANGATLDVTHGFGTNDVSVSVWQSRDGGQSYQLVRPITPDAIDLGSGRDGAANFTSTTQVNRTVAAATGSAGQTSLSVSTTAGFTADRKVLVIQMQGVGAGRFEENTVAQVSGSSLVLKTPLGNDYSSLGSNRAQVLVIPEYTDVTINAGVEVTSGPWGDAPGGVLAFKATGTVTIADGGYLDMFGSGYRGGVGGKSPKDVNNQSCPNTSVVMPLPGESGTATPSNATLSTWVGAGCTSVQPNGSGGAAGFAYNGEGMTGGSGGGNVTAGALGVSSAAGGTATLLRSAAVGGEQTSLLLMGGGGGGGSNSYNQLTTPTGQSAGGNGGNGGGIVFVTANRIINRGRIVADGGAGQAGAFLTTSDSRMINAGGGGGGAGGTVWLRAFDIDPGFVSASGGRGGQSAPTPYGGWYATPNGGDGGDGRVRIETLGKQGWVVVQPDKNTVRAINYTGQPANVRVVVRR